MGHGRKFKQMRLCADFHARSIHVIWFLTTWVTVENSSKYVFVLISMLGRVKNRPYSSCLLFDQLLRYWISCKGTTHKCPPFGVCMGSFSVILWHTYRWSICPEVPGINLFFIKTEPQMRCLLEIAVTANLSGFRECYERLVEILKTNLDETYSCFFLFNRRTKYMFCSFKSWTIFLSFSKLSPRQELGRLVPSILFLLSV